MSARCFRKVYLSVITAFFLLMAVPVSAHVTMGGSKWFFGKDKIVATIEFDSSSFAEIKGIKEGHYTADSYSDKQLQQIMTNVIQPYIDKKLSVTVNQKVYPVKVDKIERSKNNFWEIWLSVNNISYNSIENPIKIDYRLLFEETDNTHVNIAYMYLPESTTDTVQKTFEDAAPASRYTFDSNAPIWELSIKGSANEPAIKPLLVNIGEFIFLGIKHILAGYDHIAFLLALLVIGPSFKEILKIITAFTVAHSITLLLAALQIVNLNSRFVEIVIALSICYVALENLFKKEVNYRWLLTFGFGLIHGFGFASILQELIMEKSNLVPSVLSFNIGVEIGQLMIFLVMLPILYLLKNKFELRKITAATSVAVFLMGFTWLIERVLNLKLLSF